MKRSVKEEIEINASCQSIFDALVTPSAIQKYWGVHSVIIIPEENGILCMTWGDDFDNPNYVTVSRIEEIEPPNKLVLKYENYKSGNNSLPFDAKMKVHYKISTHQKTSILSVIQSGFPDDPKADDYFQGCIEGWKRTLASIKLFIEDQ